MFWTKLSHPKLIIFQAKVTTSLGSQTPQIFNFINSVGSEHLHFPKLPILTFQNNYVKVSSALLELYQCLKSLFKDTGSMADMFWYIMNYQYANFGVFITNWAFCHKSAGLLYM